jgi:hypothetical protein
MNDWKKTEKDLNAAMAFPFMTAHGHNQFAPGLTKRELFAAMAMPTAFKVYEAGYTGEPRGEETMPVLVAKVAQEMADALLKALETRNTDSVVSSPPKGDAP